MTAEFSPIAIISWPIRRVQSDRQWRDYNTIAHLAGPYRIDISPPRRKIVTTNKVPNAPYRGAGRPKRRWSPSG